MNPEGYRALRELFHRLEPLDADAREAALAEQRLSPEAEAELRRLLDAPVAPGLAESKLGDLGRKVLRDAAREDDADRPSLEGDLVRIGSYRVLRRLGQGGMGVVYEARRDDSDQTAAVKVMRPELASPEIAGRFRREIDVLRQLRHPGIAAFFDAGEATVSTRSGLRVQLPFLAMEAVDGVSLSRHADSHGLDAPQRLELMARVCDAVHHAHELGVVHRDLKPGNVLVVSGASDDVGQPKVLDFGLARAADSDLSSMTRTQAGALMGTLPYMSPEQVSGRAAEVEARSDVYSLGVMVFELLSGQLPYPVRGRPPAEGARIIQMEEPSRLASLVPGLAGPVDHVVSQALEKDPARRYASAALFAADLRAAATGSVVMARAPGLGRRLRRWTVRHPAASGAAVVGSVALVVLAWLLFQALDARAEAETNAAESQRARAEAERNARAAIEARALAEARGEELADERAALLRLADLRRVQDLEDEADRLWPADPALVADMQDWLGRAEELRSRLEDHARTLVELQDGVGPLVESLDGAERAWWMQTVEVLATNMASMLGENGSVASVRRRLEASRTLRARSIEEHADAWAATIAAVAEPRGPYGGLDLAHQLGLAPLGADSVSGLQEFWHVESGTRPVRDAETGRFPMLKEHGIVLVLVPGRTFVMGSQRDDPAAPAYDPRAEDDAPAHTVTLSPYFISKHELSQSQYARIMGENPAFFAAATADEPAAYPAESIDWVSAYEAVRRYGLTLPSEAQWEHAARGGADTPWWFGGEAADLRLHGNVGDLSAAAHGSPATWAREPWEDGWLTVAPLGALSPNPFGLHETCGNVREYCLDQYDAGYYDRSPERDPICLDGRTWDGPPRVLRDGDFASTAAESRVSQRSYAQPKDQRSSYVGVRPARPLDDTGALEPPPWLR